MYTHKRYLVLVGIFLHHVINLSPVFDGQMYLILEYRYSLVIEMLIFRFSPMVSICQFESICEG